MIKVINESIEKISYNDIKSHRAVAYVDDAGYYSQGRISVLANLYKLSNKQYILRIRLTNLDPDYEVPEDTRFYGQSRFTNMGKRRTEYYNVYSSDSDEIANFIKSRFAEILTEFDITPKRISIPKARIRDFLKNTSEYPDSESFEVITKIPFKDTTWRGDTRNGSFTLAISSDNNLALVIYRNPAQSITAIYFYKQCKSYEEAETLINKLKAPLTAWANGENNKNVEDILHSRYKMKKFDGNAQATFFER